MGDTHRRAVQSYRSRLGARGLARFEVVGREGDRALIRDLARRLAEDGADAARLRVAMHQGIAGTPAEKGGILAALRGSAFAGAGLDLTRAQEAGRDVEI